MKVVVTGAAGYIGRVFVTWLVHRPEVEQVIAVDVRPVTFPHPRVLSYRIDVRDPSLEEVLQQHRAPVLVHLAFIVQGIHNVGYMYDVNVRGSVNTFRAAVRAGVSHIVHLSSYTVYGAWPDNPPRLTEDHFPRPVPGHHYAWHKLLVEKWADALAASRPELTVTHLRAAVTVGPRCNNNLGRALRHAPALPVLRGTPSCLQLIHEEDLAEALWCACQHRTPGVFNVGGKGALPWEMIVRRAGKRPIPLPAQVWRGLLAMAWQLRLPQTSSPAELTLLSYPLVVDYSRARDVWGWSPRYTTAAAVDALVNYQR